ncbi:hypothetical protein [Bacillus benzoevorans]|uniref:AP2/ERF domain-containing protein n=2 Tax=Bacillus benzoevorans TaxID=1456 RepID=A0A7X0LXI6_9BACI|nr:hypothetical protein [Bacillus benzoevorans]
MKGRCNNPNDKKYKDYGARGIKVCDRWENSFENFLKDIGKRPSLKYSLDRIDVNGNYEPSNCRWADSVQQARNKRSQTHSVTGVRGVHLHKQMKTKRYQAVIGVNGKDISLGYFETLEEATKARKEAELKYWNKSS